MQIIIRPNFGGSIFSGPYYLVGTERLPATAFPDGYRLNIKASFGPEECAVSWDEAKAAADWLTANRIDCERCIIETPDGSSFYEARKRN